MKIIGRTKRGFIIELDEYQLAKLCGFYSPEDAWQEKGIVLEVGAEIEIDEMFKQAQEMREAKRDILHAPLTLRALADVIEREADPIKPPPANEEPKKE
jgi:hypothetical protein